MDKAFAAKNEADNVSLGTATRVIAMLRNLGFVVTGLKLISSGTAGPQGEVEVLGDYGVVDDHDQKLNYYVQVAAPGAKPDWHIVGKIASNPLADWVDFQRLYAGFSAGKGDAMAHYVSLPGIDNAVMTALRTRAGA